MGLRVFQAMLVVGVSSPAAAEILTVGSPTGMFSSIDAAITAAQDGDVILVELPKTSGTSVIPGFSIGDKSLTIMPRYTSARIGIEHVHIDGLSAGKTILIRGFNAWGQDPYGIEVRNCAGSIRFDDCSTSPFSFVPNGAGAIVQSCADVVFENTEINGGGEQMRPGLSVLDSQVALYNCEITGGDGTETGLHGGTGGTGLTTAGAGTVFLSRSTIEGGQGGNGVWGQPNGVGGDGGTAIAASNGNTQLLDCTPIPGSGGFGGLGSGPPGTIGSGFTNLSGSSRRLNIRKSILDTRPIVLNFEGSPGDLVEYAYSEVLQYATTGLDIGPLLLEPQAGLSFVQIGTIPASGELSHAIHIGDVPFQEDQKFAIQGRLTSSQGSTYHTNAPWIAIYDRCTGVVPIGSRYCDPAPANSTNLAGTLHAYGSDCVDSNSITLLATSLPYNQLCMFLCSQGQGFVANPAGSLGNLCLGGGQAIGRYNQPGQAQIAVALNSTVGGRYVLLEVDLTQLPTPGPGHATALMDDVWNFQMWYRDNGQSNFTDAVSVQFR